jgi:hypothetical protein
VRSTAGTPPEAPPAPEPQLQIPKAERAGDGVEREAHRRGGTAPSPPRPDTDDDEGRDSDDEDCDHDERDDDRGGRDDDGHGGHSK